MVKPAKSCRISPNRARSRKIWAHPVKSCQISAHLAESIQVLPNLPRSRQINSCAILPNRVHVKSRRICQKLRRILLSHVEFRQIRPYLAESCQFLANPAKYWRISLNFLSNLAKSRNSRLNHVNSRKILPNLFIS